MACTSCGRGFHNECEVECINCHTDYQQVIKTITGKIGAPIKDDQNVTDPYSTGRKRAAVKYPLYKTNPCEWRGRKNCGGGIPIIGCMRGFQEARHHGPIKNPLRNENGNVHRICEQCHNRWHTLNDAEYDEIRYSNLPHNPELATELELLENEVERKLRK